MSTSASGESGPNGAVGGLDDTGVPGAGECGAGKAYCKRFRRLAAKGDYTGLAFVEEDRERPMATVLAFIEMQVDNHPGTQWVIGFARHVGQMCSSIAASSTSSAVTPDAVQAGTWRATLPWQPNSGVRSVSPDTALGLLMA